MDGTAIVSLVQAVVFLTPLVAIIWKIAKIVNTVTRQGKDIETLNTQVKALEKAQNQNQHQLLLKVSILDKTIAKFAISMEYFSKLLNEVRNDVKGFNNNDRT